MRQFRLRLKDESQQSASTPKLGNLVKVDHGFGIETLYGHLAKALVKEGQRVKRGEVVGLVGSTD